jgi:hypothetical protein
MRVIDRIADLSVLLPAGLGALVLVGDIADYGAPTSSGFEILAIFAGISVALHVWFRAEDRWARRRRLVAARRRRYLAARSGLALRHACRTRPS